MAVDFKIDVQQADRIITIRLQGHFDHKAVHAFRLPALKALELGGNRVAIDCGGLTYIDSTAMGELVLFRSMALKKDMIVALTHASGLVRQALQMGNFQKIFEMD